MALTRKQAISVAQEGFEGIFKDPFDSANAQGILAIDPAMNFELDIYERNIRRGTRTPNQPLTGAKHGRATFSVEFIGSGGTTAPQFDVPLQASGFRKETLRKFTIPASGGAAPSATFRHGETVTQTTSGATGTVVQDTYLGQTIMWVANGNGLGNGTVFTATDILTGATSLATVTPTAVALNAGIGYWPANTAASKLIFTAPISNALSDGDVISNAAGTAFGQVVGNWSTAFIFVLYKRVSGHFANSDVVGRISPTISAVGTLATGASANAGNVQQIENTASIGMTLDGVRESLRGARGNVNFNGKYGQPFIANFDLQGVYQAIADGGDLPSTFTYTSQTPPVLIDADVGLGKTATTYAAEFLPCISEIGIDMQNEIGPRICMSDTSGILQYEIGGRNGQVTLDPELNVEAIWDFMTQFLSNTPSRMRFTVGTTPGNKFIITLPAISYTAAPTGDRSGLATRQLTGRLTTGSATALSGDSEIVIVYQVV